MPQIKPSIASCFEIYLDCQTPGLDPLTEDEQRIAFYCGFQACLQAVDVIAFISERNSEEGLEAFDGLHAEYDKFATEYVCGEISINH